MDEKARQLKKQWKAEEKDAARDDFPLADDKLEALYLTLWKQQLRPQGAITQ